MAAAATIASVAVIGMRVIQAAESLQVARAGLVIDDAGRHEQRRLEGRVVEHVEHGRHQRKRTVHAQQQRDEPEMADRGIRQHAFMSRWKVAA